MRAPCRIFLIFNLLVRKKKPLDFERLRMWFRETLIRTLKVKCSRYRLGVTQRVGRGTALLFHERDTRKGWVVRNTLRPHFTPGKDPPVPILQEAGWALGPVWTGEKSRPHWDSIPDRPARSQ